MGNETLVAYNDGIDQPVPIVNPLAIVIPLRKPETFRYLDLKFATYCKKPLGVLSVTINTEEPVIKRVRMEDIGDNTYVRFDLGKNCTVQKIRLDLVGNYKSPHIVAVWYHSNIPVYRLFMDNEQTEISVEGGPLISVITGVYNTNAHFLSKTIATMLEQTYQKWEWIITDDASTKPEVLSLLSSLSDPRIKLIRHSENKGISEAQNTSLKEVKGEWFFVLDHDDTLDQLALRDLAGAIGANPEAALIYSDEDKKDVNGWPSSPFSKPDWSPTQLFSQNYICHLCAYKTSEARTRCPDGFEKEFDGSQDYRYLFQFTKTPVTVHHLPKILYHWSVHEDSTSSGMDIKSYAGIAARRAITEYISSNRKCKSCSVLSTEYGGVYRPYVSLYEYPKVTIIVPTKDHPELIIACLDSVLCTNYPSYEIVLVDNGSDMGKLRGVYSKYEALFTAKGVRVTLIYENRPFNFSSQINMGAKLSSDSKYLLLLNNDTEILTPDWLSELVWPLELDEGIAAAGSRLLYANGSIQHAGVIMGAGGVADHCHRGHARGTGGYFSRIMALHEVSAVTGACLLVRRDRFDEVGGLCELLPKAFNDVDFCMKLRKAGWRIIYQPWSVLYHYESVSRGVDAHNDPVFVEAHRIMFERWAKEISHDPYLSSPNTRSYN